MSGFRNIAMQYCSNIIIVILQRCSNILQRYCNLAKKYCCNFSAIFLCYMGNRDEWLSNGHDSIAYHLQRLNSGKPLGLGRCEWLWAFAACPSEPLEHSSRCLEAFHCSSAVSGWSIATWANGALLNRSHKDYVMSWVKHAWMHAFIFLWSFSVMMRFFVL